VREGVRRPVIALELNQAVDEDGLRYSLPDQLECALDAHWMTVET
jgi:hypothetical protein